MIRDDFKIRTNLLETVFNSTLDYELSLYTVDINDDERAELEQGNSLPFGLRNDLAKFKGELIQHLRRLCNTDNDKVAMQAIIMLGRLIYPEKFNIFSEDNVSVKDKPLTKLEQFHEDYPDGLKIELKGVGPDRSRRHN